jgi:hypothetical protein
LQVPEKLTQTFKKGAVCFIEAATGYLIECAANPALILGLANADGGNTAASGTNNQVVELAHPDVLFRGYVDNADGNSFNTGAQTDQGKGYGITKSATAGRWFIDSSKTAANVRVVIWEFWAEANFNYIGDTTPSVIFAFVYTSANVNFQGLAGN